MSKEEEFTKRIKYLELEYKKLKHENFQLRRELEKLKKELNHES